MSFLQQAWLLERYGPRLTMEQLAETLGMSYGTLRNKLAAKTLKVRTYSDDGRRWADIRDVAEYLDWAREQIPDAVASTAAASASRRAPSPAQRARKPGHTGATGHTAGHSYSPSSVQHRHTLGGAGNCVTMKLVTPSVQASCAEIAERDLLYFYRRPARAVELESMGQL